MKIKTKLIATIVSMCAALAVMAVGVWAAATDFTLTVSNTVSMSFLATEAKVSVAGEFEVNDVPVGTYAKTELFNNNTYTGTGTRNADAFLAEIADWKLDSTTLYTEETVEGNPVQTPNFNQPASITYTWTIEPSTPNSYQNDIEVTVTEGGKPSFMVDGKDIFTASYTYTLYDANGILEVEEVQQKDLKMTPGTPVTLDFSNATEGVEKAGTVTKCEVTCTLTYAGTAAAINESTAWQYTILVKNATTPIMP